EDQFVYRLLNLGGFNNLSTRGSLEDNAGFTWPVMTFGSNPTQRFHGGGQKVASRVQASMQIARFGAHFNFRITHCNRSHCQVDQIGAILVDTQNLDTVDRALV
ncbi:hypothetical protein SB717_34300, partial [Priestia sp. SIMBA_032]|uniref:hypothetical protein n=1 Tax=Priestia sp. SIMBA_032 TaxID=3085775 RepID=UPI0039793B58